MIDVQSQASISTEFMFDSFQKAIDRRGYGFQDVSFVARTELIHDQFTFSSVAVRIRIVYRAETYNARYRSSSGCLG
jgi:hypothetical protein